MALKPAELAGFLNPLAHNHEWPTTLSPFFAFLSSPQMTGKASFSISVTLPVSHSPFVTCITSEPQMLYVQLEREDRNSEPDGALGISRGWEQRKFTFTFTAFDRCPYPE